MVNKPDNHNTTGHAEIVVQIEINAWLHDKFKYYTTPEIAKGETMKLEMAILSLIGIDADFNPLQLVIEATVHDEDGKERQVDITHMEILNHSQVNFPTKFIKYCEKRFEDGIVRNAVWT